MGGRHTSRVAESLDRFVEDLVIDWAAQPVAVKRLLPSDEWRDIDVADLRQQQATAKARLEEKIRVNFERPDQVTDEQLYVFTELTNKRIIEIDQILAKALPQSPTLALAEAAGTSTDLAERRKKVRTLWEKYSLGTKRAIIRELVIIRLLPAPSGKHFDSRTVEVTWNL